MVRLFVFLLIICLALYFGPNLYTSTTDQAIKVAGTPVQDIAQIKVLLAGGIAFFQVAIVIFALLDQIANTIKLIIKPFAVLLPLVAFLATMYQTFMPVIAPFLPNQVASTMGADASINMTSWVNSPEFTTGILLTLAMMLFFLATYKALTAESSELRTLRAELAKAKRAKG